MNYKVYIYSKVPVILVKIVGIRSIDKETNQSVSIFTVMPACLK